MASRRRSNRTRDVEAEGDGVHVGGRPSRVPGRCHEGQDGGGERAPSCTLLDLRLSGYNHALLPAVAKSGIAAGISYWASERRGCEFWH